MGTLLFQLSNGNPQSSRSFPNSAFAGARDSPRSFIWSFLKFSIPASFMFVPNSEW